ncbi:hypothetical protein [Mangrovivirga cuniculi]|uniref:Prepilin-type N-terminal cleavage/methylation domain-containing protein n=1 Tax=Mangrovivirga cuniculi TaxID=2715131 RepID=A0A4D7JMC3_9BACT|nr:hypothetical protein [Mangrovivirga cuniculi]QCK13762.1 hypothetical protein DCC35_02815 [Mangrovivirga cuniculi]
MNTLFKNKVPSFTIFETIIALLLATIVVSMIYITYRLTINEIGRVKNVISNNIDITKTNYLIEKEVFDCDQIEAAGNRLNFYDNNILTSSIDFNSNLIILSKNNLSDTLLMADNIHLNLGFHPSANNLLNRLSVKLNKGNQDMELYFYKKYDISSLLNKNGRQ